ncbi:hypothetical protein GQ54DRAFT_178435 [Martensiomyces pterosporus]|nr:hypothetical protein GQ54DRAFT_178435 [Martensiomyces pterosporus]
MHRAKTTGCLCVKLHPACALVAVGDMSLHLCPLPPYSWLDLAFSRGASLMASGPRGGKIQVQMQRRACQLSVEVIGDGVCTRPDRMPQLRLLQKHLLASALGWLAVCSQISALCCASSSRQIACKRKALNAEAREGKRSKAEGGRGGWQQRLDRSFSSVVQNNQSRNDPTQAVPTVGRKEQTASN